ncbi:MAG: hypothetical protein KAT16_01805 [Candidatus Heimdallarchaeota archaeon]|nr:hypothetical protein [Candidatus Heimdallarchaeota archaeon]
MEKIATYKSQFSTYTISANVYSKNNGLIIDVVAPNEHLGGIGVGIPYCRKNGKKTANSHAISIPEHRDAELASKLAQIVAKHTEMNIIVILGIHIPNITNTLLKELYEFFETWFTKISIKLAKLSS